MLTIEILPELSNTYHRLTNNLDKYYYKELQKPSGYPNLEEFRISGSGALVAETIQIYKNDILVGNTISDSNGDFTFLFDPEYKIPNIIYAEGGSSGKSNMVYFDCYNFLLFLYTFADEYLKALVKLGQAKQDIFISTGVGDDVQPTFPTDVSSYDTSFNAIKGHMPLKVPSEYWASSYEDLLKEAISISENALVHSSIYAMKTVFENAGCTDVFFWPQENFKWMNIDKTVHPRVNITDKTKLVIPENWLRLKWGIQHIKETTLQMSGGATNYIWIYVDGTTNVDGTLEIKTTTTQPLPSVTETTKTYLITDIKVDDSTGSNTDIPLQKYVEVDPPVWSMGSSISIVEGVGGHSINNMKLKSRRILGLGTANINDSIYVAYKYHSEPVVICVVGIDVSNEIVNMYRTLGMAGHIRSMILEQMPDIELYAKFSSIPSAAVKKALREVLDLLNPIYRTLRIWATSVLGDQTTVVEDSVDWGGYFKNYKFIGKV